MKRSIVAAFLLIVGLPLAAAAAPFLVCNPYTGMTLTTGQTLTYNISGLPASFAGAANIPPDSTGTYAFALDVSSLPAGSYTVTAGVCINDPAWGQACSPQSAPFSFSRPLAPTAAPSSLGLSIKQ